jgi:tetratricopeptide (TPR) repeat protein
MDVQTVNKNLVKARELMARKRFVDALNIYATAAKHAPQVGGEYGRAAADSGDYDLADRIWQKFMSQQTLNARILARLSEDYQSMGMHGPGRKLMEKAANMEPHNLDLQFKYAVLVIRISSPEEARAAVQRCLDAAPGNERGRFLLAHLDRRQGRSEQAEAQLRELLTLPMRDAPLRYAIHAELAQILERANRFDDAMLTLEEGKKVARQAFNLEAQRKAYYERHEKVVRTIVALPKNILETWGKSFPERVRTPIAPMAFLSGAARSGTTLLERILDAHPSVAACDEPPAFKAAYSQIELSPAPIPGQRLDLLRKRYVSNVRKSLESPCDGKTLVDKNPSRSVWLPGLLRIVPEMRIITALRDPRDVIVSLYFQDQERTNNLTLAQLAEHYCRVMDVWLAVRDWEGLQWIETRYEDTVADLEKEGTRVTKFLGLEWHENQVRYYERNREKTVTSTNHAAVTQPIYTRSVGRWPSYEKYLAPIFPMLEPYCRRFGYR